jgi:hypothetical protein
VINSKWQFFLSIYKNIVFHMTIFYQSIKILSYEQNPYQSIKNPPFQTPNFYRLIKFLSHSSFTIQHLPNPGHPIWMNPGLSPTPPTGLFYISAFSIFLHWWRAVPDQGLAQVPHGLPLDLLAGPMMFISCIFSIAHEGKRGFCLACRVLPRPPRVRGRVRPWPGLKSWKACAKFREY